MENPYSGMSQGLKIWEGGRVIRGAKNMVGQALRAGGIRPPCLPPSDMPDIGLLTTYFHVIIQWETHQKIHRVHIYRCILGQGQALIVKN